MKKPFQIGWGGGRQGGSHCGQRRNNRLAATQLVRGLRFEPLEDRRLLSTLVNVAFKVFNAAETAQVDSMNVGGDYKLQVYVQDAQGGALGGVFQAYFDLTFPNIISFPTSLSDLQYHDSVFTASTHGTGSAGSMLDVGGLTPVRPANPGDSLLLLDVPIHVTSAGTGTFAISGDLVHGANASTDTVQMWDSIGAVPLDGISFTGPGAGGGAITVTSIPAPDLTVTKADNVSQNTTLGNNWTWTLHVANTGNAPATFSSGQTLLLDNLPNNNIGYGTVSVANLNSVTGTVAAGISAADDLTATASGGSVTIAAGGSFDVQFTATPSAIGTYANPRIGGIATADPNNNVDESNETNNTASDTVTVTAPNLTLTKADSVSQNTTLGNNWTWTLHVANTGNAAAIFSSGQALLSDNLPNSNIGYGTVSVANLSGVTGTIAAGISAADDLTATANGGSVTIAAGGSFDVQFTATPSAIGAFANPRIGGAAMVDPNNVVVESNETNNAADTVTVTAPDLTVTKTDDVNHSTTLGHPWTWTLHVANAGNAAAIFTSGQRIVVDNLPGTNIQFGTPTVANLNGVTGTVTASFIGSDIVAVAGATDVIIPPGGSFDVQFTVTPGQSGSYANIGTVDPDNCVVESNENNNTGSDTVQVGSVDLTLTKADNVSQNTTLGNSWTWTLHVLNAGTAAAIFASGQTILLDNLPNSNVGYGTVSVANLSGVTGTIAAGISAADDLTATANGGSVTIAAGGSFDVQFTAAPGAIGAFANPRDGGAATVDPDNDVFESDESNNTAADTVTVRAPDLTLTKTDSVGQVTTLGNGWTWTLHVANAGNADAIFTSGQRIIVDDRPDGIIGYGPVTFANQVGITGTIAASLSAGDDLTVTANGGDVIIPPGGGFDVIFIVTPPTAIGAYVNPRAGGVAIVDPDGCVVESNESNNTASDTVTVIAPDLTLTKTDSVSQNTTLGNSWTWTLHVLNAGNAPATFNSAQMLLLDNLPNSNIGYGAVTVTNLNGITGTITASISAADDLTATANGGSVTVAAGGSFDVQFTATASAIGTFTNPRDGGAAMVDPDNDVVESNENNNTATDAVTVVEPDLTLTKTDSVNHVTTPGNPWTWTLHVLNAGHEDAIFTSGQTILLDNLPNGNITYGTVVTPSNTTGSIDASGNLTVTVDAGQSVTIAAGGSFDVQFTATAEIGTYANPRDPGTATVDPDNVVVESDETNNTASDTVTVTSGVDLTLTKTDNVSHASTLGNSWTWTLHVANNGNETATFSGGQRLLLDNLPNGNITYGTVVTPSNTTGSIDANGNLTVTVDAGQSVTIPAGGSFDVQFTATPSAIGTFVNPRSDGAAMVDPDNDVGDINENNNTGADTVTVTAPDLTLTKADSVSHNTTLGNPWTWTLHVANAGNADATFASGQRIALDNLPTGNVTYGTVTFANQAGVSGTGTLSGSIDGSGNLTLTASGGSVIVAAGTGGFDAVFTATPTAIGVFVNPRDGGTAMVDPDNDVVESNENNNTAASDTVTVTAPDLTLTKADSVSQNTTLGNNWTWTLHVANAGNADATFASGQRIALDNLPTGNVTYGTVTFANQAGVSGTGTLSGSIDGSGNLTLTASGGSVILAAGTGGFDAVFTATPTAIGVFVNPRDGGAAMVDPDNDVVESNENNNTAASDTVTVTAPDLTLTKADSVSQNTTLGNPWTWTLHVANAGNADATFASGQRLVLDNLPTGNVTYGTITFANQAGISGTGTLSGSIDGSGNLTLTASGGVILAAGTGAFDAIFTATPSAIGTFINPRASGAATVDPDNVVVESNESNNTATDTVTVTAPDLTLTKTDSVSHATTPGNPWTWTLHVANVGNAPATFSSGQNLLLDNLPNSNIGYGSVTVTNLSGVTGTIAAGISAADDLTATASGGSVTVAAGGSFDLQFTATATAVGAFVNPRTSGTAAVDPDNVVVESNENNNTASDTVTVRIANSSIVGFVYCDNDYDGVYTGEATIPHVTITLQYQDSTGGWLNWTTSPYEQTNDAGWYGFANLPAGTYRVIETQPVQFTEGGPKDPHTIVVTLPDNTRKVANFGVGGLLPQYISRRLFLSSTPKLSQIVRDLNVPPVVDLNGPASGNNLTTKFFAGGGPITIAPAATISDSDSPTLVSLAVTDTNPFDGAAEVLDATVTGTSISKFYVNGVLTLTGVAPVADYATVLRSITFNNTSATPDAVDNRIVTFVAFDGMAYSTVATATISDPPAPSSSAHLASLASSPTAGVSLQQSIPAASPAAPVSVSTASAAVVENAQEPTTAASAAVAGLAESIPAASPAAAAVAQSAPVENAAEAATEPAVPSVVRSGSEVVVTGTAGDDTLQFVAGTAENTVIVGGQSYAFPVGEVTAFHFVGGGGNDTATLTAAGLASLAETAQLQPGSATLQGVGYTVDVANVPNVQIDGRGAGVQAVLFDSPGDDSLTVEGDVASLSGDGFVERVFGFKQVRASGVAGGLNTLREQASDFLLEKVGNWVEEVN